MGAVDGGIWLSRRGYKCFLGGEGLSMCSQEVVLSYGAILEWRGRLEYWLETVLGRPWFYLEFPVHFF